MSAATLTSKGQITIPAAVRAKLGVDMGDRVEFVETGCGRYEIVAATLSVEMLKGIVRKPAKAVPVEAMRAAVRTRAAKALKRP